MSKTVSFSLEEATIAALRAESEKSGVPLSAIANFAIRERIAELDREREFIRRLKADLTKKTRKKS